MTQPSNQKDLVRALLISVALFVFGDKITTVAEILIRGYDCLVHNCTSKPQFILEISLLALVVGVSAVILLIPLKPVPDPKEEQTLLIGLLVGIIAGFLEITKVAFSTSEALQDYSRRGYFFFMVYLAVFFLPTIPLAVHYEAWVRQFRALLIRLSKVLIVGFLVAIIVQLTIGLLMTRTGIVPTTHLFHHAPKDLIFNPLALVAIGSIFCAVAFALQDCDNAAGPRAAAWPLSYTVFAFLFGFDYFIFFAAGSNKPLIADSYLLTAVSFGLLAASPLAGQSLARFMLRGRAGHRRWLVELSCGFAFTAAAMLFGLSHAISSEVMVRIFAAFCMGLAGLAVPLVLLITKEYRWRDA